MTGSHFNRTGSRMLYGTPPTSSRASRQQVQNTVSERKSLAGNSPSMLSINTRIDNRNKEGTTVDKGMRTHGVAYYGGYVLRHGWHLT